MTLPAIMPPDELCKRLVLAAKRPLSLAELASAASDSDLDLGEELEVSSGIRPIVQFKQMTALGGNVEDHNAMALCCLRTLEHAKGQDRQQAVNNVPFLRYAIEFIMKHFDNADDESRAVFLHNFDYCDWQKWAVCLPVYAALYTYSFGGALLRLKCARLADYMLQQDRSKLTQGLHAGHGDRIRHSFRLSPWHGAEDFDTRRQRRQQQRDLLLGVGPSDRAAPSTAPLPVADAIPPSSPADSSFSFEDVLAPEPASPDEITLNSFEMVDTPSEDDLWEEIEFQEAILESLNKMKVA